MLIRTKLQVPPLKYRLLYRKHLIRRLCEAKEYQLIQLSGPAGSGKTSLACQWIKKDLPKTAWYSLDEEDNVPDVFFRYLFTSLIHAEQALEKNLGLLLENKRELSIGNVVPNLIESLYHLPVTIHLVLDDFHHIVNREIHAALARLIQYIPDRLRLVILSRSCLPATMDAVAIKKERMELSASDLKFTRQETADLFENVIPLNFSVNQIDDLNRHIEGWAAGLQLVALSVRTGRDGFDLSSILNQAHEKAIPYLIADIMRMQSEEIRNVVFATALLDRFTPELCAEITGVKDAAGLLKRLERMNLFLIPLDARRKWYRYHHMFSEVVRRQVSLEAPELILNTLRKAALWFAANDYLEDAMRSAFKYNDDEFAADLMENYLIRYIVELDITAGLRWILKLPLEILKQRTLLRLYQCMFLLTMMELSDLKKILATIERGGNSALQRYSGDKRTLCEDFIIFLKCILQILHADHSTGAIQHKTLSKKISLKNQLFSIGIEILIGSILISKGQLSSAERLIAKVSALLPAYDLMVASIFLAKSKALIARHRGRLHQSEAILGQALKALKRQSDNNTSQKFLLHRHLGHILYLQNKLTEAREYAVMAIRHCEYSGLLDDILAASELRLLLYLAAQEIDRAAECLQQMRAYSVKLGMPQIAASADACAARIAVTQGNLGPAMLWSQRRSLKMDERFSLLFANECLTQARLLFARGQISEVAQLLETLRNRCLKRDLLELVLQIDIFQCAVFHAMNKYGKAVALLKETLFFSETEGYVRPFVDNAKLIAPIFRRLEEELPGTSRTVHFKKIFAACDIPLKESAIFYLPDKDDQKDLTQREIEILQWMETGLQNKQIAHKAFISVSTVKTHVRHIIAKLGVRTRSQAIFKAKKFGILDQN